MRKEGWKRLKIHFWRKLICNGERLVWDGSLVSLALWSSDNERKTFKCWQTKALIKLPDSVRIILQDTQWFSSLKVFLTANEASTGGGLCRDPPPMQLLMWEESRWTRAVQGKLIPLPACCLGGRLCNRVSWSSWEVPPSLPSFLFSFLFCLFLLCCHRPLMDALHLLPLTELNLKVVLSVYHQQNVVPESWPLHRITDILDVWYFCLFFCLHLSVFIIRMSH